MTNKLTDEQIRAYQRFVRAAEKVKLIRTTKNFTWPYVPHRDYMECVRPDGAHHPMFIENEPWEEYKIASEEWWRLEPDFRKSERMRASYGDYGDEDNWDDEPTEVKDTYQVLKGE